MSSLTFQNGKSLEICLMKADKFGYQHHSILKLQQRGNLYKSDENFVSCPVMMNMLEKCSFCLFPKGFMMENMSARIAFDRGNLVPQRVIP